MRDGRTTPSCVIARPPARATGRLLLPPPILPFPVRLSPQAVARSAVDMTGSPAEICPIPMMRTWDPGRFFLCAARGASGRRCTAAANPPPREAPERPRAGCRNPRSSRKDPETTRPTRPCSHVRRPSPTRCRHPRPRPALASGVTPGPEAPGGRRTSRTSGPRPDAYQLRRNERRAVIAFRWTEAKPSRQQRWSTASGYRSRRATWSLSVST